MPLTNKEKAGFSEILQYLNQDDLIALKDTVTGKLIAATNKKEAIQVILVYTDSAVELLKRRKIKRDFIFGYLATKGVAVTPNADKNKLIRAVLAYWESNLQQVLPDYEDEEDDQRVPHPNARQAHHRGETGQARIRHPAIHAAPIVLELSDSDDADDDHVAGGVLQVNPHHHGLVGLPQRNAAFMPAPERPGIAGQPYNINRNPTLNAAPIQAPDPRPAIKDAIIHAPAPPGPVATRAELGAPAPATSVTQQLAKQFVTWFFQQLNALSPQLVQDGGASDWGPQHFFNDCKLKLNIHSQDSRMEEFEGAETVSERFRDLVQTEGLLFNPNVDEEGTKGMNDPHGLVIVFVCGTIHREGLCLGVFEQRFGLVRDPLNQNNWKIKFTDVNVKSEAVNQVPKLGNVSSFPALTGVS